jgi:putative methionine-R-sulfoxide reductase with GAF domain/streptogramin lyase
MQKPAMRNCLAILILITSFAEGAYGQYLDEKDFHQLTSKDGLSSDRVNGIVQDSIGYIWASTSAGLNRYDGKKIVQFHSEKDSLSLPSEDLGGMGWLNKSCFGVYTAGLHVVNTKTGKTRNIFIPYADKSYEYKFNVVMRAIGDEEGNIFIVSRSGFYHFDKNYQLVFRYDYIEKEKVALAHFFFNSNLLEIDARLLLVSSLASVYDKEKRQLIKIGSSVFPVLSEFVGEQSRYHCFFQFKPGHFIISRQYSDSIFYVIPSQNKCVPSKLPFNTAKEEFHFRSKILVESDTSFYVTGHLSGFYKLRLNPHNGSITIDPRKYLRSLLCQAMLIDKDGKLWIATDKGLLWQDPRKPIIKTGYLPQAIPDSFPNFHLCDVYASGPNVYVGNRGNSGLLLFDRNTLQFKKQFIFPGNNGRGNSIYAITAMDSNSLILGTDSPVLLFDEKKQSAKEIDPPQWGEGIWTSDLFRDSRNRIWLTAYFTYYYDTRERKFRYVKTHPSLLSVPSCVAEDRNGNIWMGGHGLARYNVKLDSFDFYLDSFPFIKMPDKQVHTMVIDAQNNIWFNSNNNGLVSYNIDNKKYNHFTKESGLPDNDIAALYVVGDMIWVASFSGLSCINSRTLHIEKFGTEVGLPDVPITKFSRFYYDNNSRELFFSYSNALVKFNPFQLLNSKKPPRVFIENITFNGNRSLFIPAGEIETSWRENDIRCSIGTIDFLTGSDQAFEFRIAKEINSPWQELGKQSTFSISNLPTGIHRLQVKVVSLSNHWPPQIREIRIKVLPPFWKTNWFIGLFILALSFLFYWFIRWRTNRATRKEMEKTNIEKIKAENYKSQFELEQISNFFSTSLADKKNEEEVLWAVTSNLIKRLCYEDCMIYLWNKDKTKMIQRAAYGPKGNPEFIQSQVFDVVPGQGVVGHVMQTMQPVLIPDTRKDPRYRVDEMFRLSEVCVPIIHNGELIGIIDSEHPEPHYFKERDLKILTTIATLLGNKLKQLESENSLEAKRRELSTINEKLVEARLSALQAQMNPHFVFNALNSIKRMILDKDNEKASRYLSKFALMIRMTLNHSKEIFVSLEETVEYLKTYLEMEQLRFDDSFTFSINTGQNIDVTETAIPSLMIQPLVENAIWHGLMPSQGDKKIRILFTQQENKITCSIEDNGIGIRASEKLKEGNTTLHRSVGLENIRNRIRMMNEKYNTECTLEIIDLGEINAGCSGTKVILQLNSINL